MGEAEFAYGLLRASASSATAELARPIRHDQWRLEVVSSQLQRFPALLHLLDRQLALTPRHASSLNKRFGMSTEEHLAMADQIAGWIIALAGSNLDQVLLDYDWICQLVLNEEMNFRRTGRYRLTTVAEAADELYSNDELMSLCISDVPV